ncbi:MAG: hypothetical protein JWO36_5632 [Myxococcales bacterium]|nr:hypothetical protein [Myxococcales bacterium]
MSDDLDDLLRRAMKTLDDQVPSGYFDGLPNQTLVRLEASMQTGTSGTTTRDPAASSQQMAAMASPAAAAPPREEDSGLHDIRSLAQSTKQGLRKRSTTNQPVGDELAASSGAWKHVALPEPAKMVSLPALDELPSREAVLAAEKAAKKSARDIAREPAVDPAAAAEATSGKPAFSAWADRAPKNSRKGLYAMVGVGLATAAGVMIFLMTKNAGDDKSAKSANVAALGPDVAAEKRALPTAAPVVEPVPQAQIAAGAVDTTAADPSAKDQRAAPVKAVTHVGKGAAKDKPVDKVDKPEKVIKQADTGKTEKKTGGKDGDPSFDDLLKEAGVDGQKKADKPKLEKKSLSEADFKHGIGAVATKAAGCYKGTQGTATVKLTIASSGQVSKVSVGGLFSGKPEADCVANAVKSASFPPWDGGPQSFSYAYLLSE